MRQLTYLLNWFVLFTCVSVRCLSAAATRHPFSHASHFLVNTCFIWPDWLLFHHFRSFVYGAIHCDYHHNRSHIVIFRYAGIKGRSMRTKPVVVQTPERYTWMWRRYLYCIDSIENLWFSRFCLDSVHAVSTDICQSVVINVKYTTAHRLTIYWPTTDHILTHACHTLF